MEERPRGGFDEIATSPLGEYKQFPSAVVVNKHEEHGNMVSRFVASRGVCLKKFVTASVRLSRAMTEIRPEVRIHTTQPVQNLVCGNATSFAPVKPKARNRNASNAPESEFDFTGFAPPITGYRKTRAKTVVRLKPSPTIEEVHPLKKFRSVKREVTIVPKLETQIHNYGDAHRRKALQIHQDWEEFYMHPLHGRMRRQLTGRRYSEFSETRTRALSELEARSGGPPSALCSGPAYGALEDEEAADIPYVKIPTDGLRDRIHNNRKRNQHEEQLARMVRDTDGSELEPFGFRERNTVDVEGWKRLPDVRSFVASGPDPVRKGRRPFSEILHSRIDEAMGHF
jgi:hypothetical protein